MFSYKMIMQKRRTRQPIIVVALTVIFIHILCIYADPATNWSSRSLAGFRNLFPTGRSGKPPSRHYNQYRNYQSNSSLAPQLENIRSVNKDTRQYSYNQARNRPSSSTQISKRRLSWNSPPNTLYPSPRTVSGHQYNSHSRYLYLKSFYFS